MKFEISDSPVSRDVSSHQGIMEKKRKNEHRTAKAFSHPRRRFAQLLQMNKLNTIGVIVPDLVHDFFTSAISGIEEIASQAGYAVFLCQSNESFEKEVVSTNLLMRERVAGIIVSISQTTTSGSHFHDVRKRKIPLVFFDRICKDVVASNVTIDDYKSAFDAVTYLIGKGYKRIIHFAGPEVLGICENRRRGYLDALKHAQNQQAKMVFHGGLQAQDGYGIMDSLIKADTIPEAIFAVNDTVALGAFRRIKEAGLKIPDDVALMGFSNNEVTTLIDPPLTTVAQPSYEMGRKSAEILIGTIEGRIKDCKTLVLDTTLIIRGSA